MIRFVAIVAAVTSALLAGVVVLMLRRWRNDVLSRHGQPGYKDVAFPREAMIVSALVGSGLALLGRQLGTMLAFACSPALLFVAFSVALVYHQSRTRLP